MISWRQARDHGFDQGGIGGQGSIFRQSPQLDARHPQIEVLDETISVPVTRLDTLCAARGIEQIDLLHVDVQGAEFEVMVGLGQLRPALIFLEVTTIADGGWIGAAAGRELHALMARLGYLLVGDFLADRLYLHASLAERLSHSPRASKT
jgi:hypothetical protein